MIKSLESFEHFFLQDQNSAEALEELGFQNYTISGDTRFDRVSQQLTMDNTLDFVSQFKKDNLCVVCGSTWPEDDKLIIDYINNHEGKAKFIIAPHEIKEGKISAFIGACTARVARYSTMDINTLKDYDVLIVDTIGLLTKIYSYADVAYVGGAMGNTGLHNILEPATFGVPILIGPHFNKFPEAKILQQLAGLYAVASQDQFDERLNKLLSDDKFRAQTGMIAGHFINSNTGATRAVIDYIKGSN